MAWQHAGWIELTDQASRVTMLRQHITEVSQQVGRSVSADGKAVSSADVRMYLADLKMNLKDEEAKLARMGSGGRRVASFAYGDWPNRGSGPVC